jgi:mono/diheme cytochrome c family protein
MSFRKTVVVLMGIAAAAVLFAALGPRRAESPVRIDRGRYLVASLGCADCHASKVLGPEGPEPDMARFLAGHSDKSELPPPPQLPVGPWMTIANTDLTAWSGPWGISYAINLTPDENTGIGSWSEDTFVKALKTGRHMGVSRPILPPMPWTAFRNLTDDDLRSIFAYLRTIPAVHNRVPEPVPPAAVATDAGK